MNRNKIVMTLVCYILLALSLIGVFIYQFIVGLSPKEETKIEIETSEPILDKTPKVEIEEQKESEIYLLTAYCSCYVCSEGYGDMTATGKRAVEGRTIAVDPKVIPYGTEIYIEGVGYRIAQDCGNLVKGKHIDVYFDCHSKVNDFGKRYAEVEI